MDYVANVFMALDDDVNLQIEGIDENDFVARFADAAERGALPTLVNTGSETMLALGTDGFLDERAAGEMVEQLGRERFYDSTLDMLASEVPRAPFAVPFHGWVQGIWYRKDWFEEAGLAPPTNWHHLLTAAQRLHDPAEKRYGILVGTEADIYAAQTFTQIALANDAALFDDVGEPVVTAAPMIDALAFYRDLARYAPPGSNTPRARDFFLQGRLAMMFYSTFIMDDLANAAEAADALSQDHFPELDGASFDATLVDRVGMVPVLVEQVPAAFGSINAIGITKGLDPETRELARAFLRFVFRPDIYITWLHMAPGGMMPVLRDIAQSEDFLRDPMGIFQRYGRERITRIIAGFDNIRTFSHRDGRFYPEASRAFAAGVVSRMVRSVASGQSTPEAAAVAAEGELRQLRSGR
jgi:multiple sugar transport system substrate-binding protein